MYTRCSHTTKRPKESLWKNQTMMKNKVSMGLRQTKKTVQKLKVFNNLNSFQIKKLKSLLRDKSSKKSP